MPELIIASLIVFLLLAGTFFFAVATLGLLRLPDVFCRMHATTKCDTLGTGLVLLAAAMDQGWTMTSVKIVLVILFIWITTPTAAHAIARSEFQRQARLIDKGQASDEEDPS